MRPAKQGGLDSLCGLYAIVNAIELVGVTGRRSTLHEDLFAKLICALPPHRLRSGLVCGLDVDDLLTASRGAFRWLRKAHGVDLRIRTPFADREFVDGAGYVQAIRGQNEAWRKAVIIGVAIPGGSHWTVLRAIEGRRLYVRDSGRLTHLDLSRFDLKRGRYHFIAEDTLVIHRRL